MGLLVGVAVHYAGFYASQGRETAFETTQEDSHKAETAQEEPFTTTPATETKTGPSAERLR